MNSLDLSKPELLRDCSQTASSACPAIKCKPTRHFYVRERTNLSTATRFHVSNSCRWMSAGCCRSIPRVVQRPAQSRGL